MGAICGRSRDKDPNKPGAKLSKNGGQGRDASALSSPRKPDRVKGVGVKNDAAELAMVAQRRQKADKALLQFAEEGSVQGVQLALEGGADPKQAADWARCTSLHLASASGCRAVVELLLKRKADVRARNNTNSTPLHVAAANGRAEAVTVLIVTGGADIDAVDGNGRTASQLAQENGQLQIREVVRRAVRHSLMTPRTQQAQESLDVEQAALQDLIDDPQLAQQVKSESEIPLLALQGLSKLEKPEFTEDLDDRRKKERQIVMDAEQEHEAMIAQGLLRRSNIIWFLIDALWLKSWKNFTEKGSKEDVPGPIINHRLLDSAGQPHAMLKPQTHYRCLGELAWLELYKVYGGGPELRRLEPNIYSASPATNLLGIYPLTARRHGNEKVKGAQTARTPSRYSTQHSDLIGHSMVNHGTEKAAYLSCANRYFCF